MAFDPRDWLIDRTEKPCLPTSSVRGSFEVAEVFPGSIAEAAGIVPGMLYRPQDDEAVDPIAIRDKQAEGELISRFIDFDRSTLISLTTRGYPFGMALERPLQALCADLNGPDEASYRLVDAVLQRVHDDDENALWAIVRALKVHWEHSALGRIGTRLLGLSGLSERPAEYMLVAGIDLVIRGDLARARPLMESSIAAIGGQNSAIALGLFGQALLLEAEGGPDGEVDHLLEMARQQLPTSLRVRRKIAQRMGGMAPQPDPGFPGPFPLNYVLAARDPLHDRGDALPDLVSLRTALARLGPRQCLLVVLLHGYRANGYYSYLTYQLGLLLPLLADLIPEVHVVTGYRGGNPHDDIWLEGEAFACRRGMRPSFLFDPDNLVAHLLDSHSAPDAVIVDNSGQILYRGALQGERGYWTALEAVRRTAKVGGR